MITKGQVQSFNKSTNRDVFNNTGYPTHDHIWPTNEGGSNTQVNVQWLTQSSNSAKGDDLKGSVNGIKFAIEPAGTDSFGRKIGKMYVGDATGWYEVIPTR